MIELTLKAFLQNRTQSEAAIVLGINQSAVSQMIAAGRDVRIRMDDKGNVIETYERKPVGLSAQSERAA